MATHPFLSDEWIEAARAIREDYADHAEPMASPVRMNQVVTDVPFGAGVLDAHLDTTSGTMEVEVGHLEHPDVTVTLDYATARAVFVGQDKDVAMQAFMAGKIKVQGDMTKLLAMFSDNVHPLATEVAERIKAITE
ncbi:MAG: SCP2 sterol-binding domain-containing protein [Actinobacteria bacterium]|nr:SCP2 sterol-binding domain-containing protein [Actinomycetota bacterium]